MLFLSWQRRGLDLFFPLHAHHRSHSSNHTFRSSQRERKKGTQSLGFCTRRFSKEELSESLVHSLRKQGPLHYCLSCLGLLLAGLPRCGQEDVCHTLWCISLEQFQVQLLCCVLPDLRKKVNAGFSPFLTFFYALLLLHLVVTFCLCPTLLLFDSVLYSNSLSLQKELQQSDTPRWSKRW